MFEVNNDFKFDYRVFSSSVIYFDHNIDGQCFIRTISEYIETGFYMIGNSAII